MGIVLDFFSFFLCLISLIHFVCSGLSGSGYCWAGDFAQGLFGALDTIELSLLG